MTQQKRVQDFGEAGGINMELDQYTFLKPPTGRDSRKGKGVVDDDIYCGEGSFWWEGFAGSRMMNPFDCGSSWLM